MTFHTTLQTHWKTDARLGLHYPNQLHDSSLSFSRLRGLNRQFSLHKRGRLVKSHRHSPVRYGIHVRDVHACGGRANFDMPTKISAKELEPNSRAHDILVVSFYHFVRIEDPEEEVARHRAFLEGWDIKGRIYINQQGINAQYSGPFLDALAYAEWVKEDVRFKQMLVQTSPSSTHAFPRLKLRYKSSLVQVEGDVSNLPLLDPSMRALALTPREWKERLGIQNCSETERDESSTRENTSLDRERKLLLLDVRNGYEWDIGHFHGAKRPDVECFRNTTFGNSHLETSMSDPLAGIDKENTDILMYCTGGIRCDVYSVILRQKGFQNLYTLKGGIIHYLKEEGPVKWVGNLFVFDSRLSISPNMYKPLDASNIQWMDLSNGRIWGDEDYHALYDSSFGRCHLCGSHLSEMRHRNCANLDCNKLILSCQKCVQEFRGCCSTACTNCPRLRPILYNSPIYERWHKYQH